jgi:Zn-finger nucleic acid-binding protein
VRGVWLDRGELDKIIDRAQPAQSSHTAQDD